VREKCNNYFFFIKDETELMGYPISLIDALLPDVIEARRQALFNIIQKQTEINKQSSLNNGNNSKQHNNGNHSISCNNNHENKSNSIIINDPVYCALVHFENDLKN
jgi:hypothetical protein